MMKQYNTYSFKDEINWSAVPEEKLGFFLWDSAAAYDVFFKMCFVKDKGIFLRMRCNETLLRAEATERDGRVWEDSCMEMFLCPFEDREEYVNFEINCKGVYLSQFGSVRENRTFIKELTALEAETETEITPDGWMLKLFVPAELISEVYSQKFTAGRCSIKGNFTKCGDKTQYPHYGSFCELGSLDMGFHNPKKFICINIEERYYNV